MISLFSILTSIKPTKDLLYSVLCIIPKNHKVSQCQVQFVLASFQYWAINTSKVFLSSVSQLSNKLMAQVESGEETQIVLAKILISILTIWFNQKLSPGK